MQQALLQPGQNTRRKEWKKRREKQLSQHSLPGWPGCGRCCVIWERTRRVEWWRSIKGRAPAPILWLISDNAGSIYSPASVKPEGTGLVSLCLAWPSLPNIEKTFGLKSFCVLVWNSTWCGMTLLVSEHRVELIWNCFANLVWKHDGVALVWNHGVHWPAWDASSPAPAASRPVLCNNNTSSGAVEQ